MDIVYLPCNPLAEQQTFLFGPIAPKVSAKAHRIKTPTYHTFDEKELFQTAFEIYRHLEKWISWETTKEQIAEKYIAHGACRHEQKFDLAEVVQALILMRRHLWKKVKDDGLLDTVLDMHQALELNRQVVLYFDRAVYFTIIGYMRAAK